MRHRHTLGSIVAEHGRALREAQALSGAQLKALRAIERCRTPALGGQLWRCDQCEQLQYRFHSCRDRHCPQCQNLARERWLQARRAELLPVPYFHLVFTLPESLRPLSMGNPRRMHAMLFRCVAGTLKTFAADPRWLGGEIAATLVLHTWTQRLDYHPHIHVLIAGGALSREGQWIGAHRGFLFPVHALSKVFRGKYLHALENAMAAGAVRFSGSTASLSDVALRRRFVANLRNADWVVYAKPSARGPQQVLDYLARYTHKTALSNERILGADSTEVRFAWRDRAHGNKRRTLRLPAQEFLGRFIRHVLPRGFTRIRHVGLLASRHKSAKLTAARSALQAPPPDPSPTPESAEQYCLRVLGLDIHQCPHCDAGRLRFAGALAPARRSRDPPSDVR